MVAHKRFGTVFRRRRLLVVLDSDKNDNEPKTNEGRKQKCTKTKTPKNETGSKLANCQFLRRKRNSVGLYSRLMAF